jgi:hypothetical protein
VPPSDALTALEDEIIRLRRIEAAARAYVITRKRADASKATRKQEIDRLEKLDAALGGPR